MGGKMSQKQVKLAKKVISKAVRKNSDILRQQGMQEVFKAIGLMNFKQRLKLCYKILLKK
jgi:hypothetical protein